MYAWLGTRKIWFMTLTTRDENQDREQALRDINAHWQTLLKRMRRRYGKVQYLRVIQFHRNGCPHIHALVDVGVSQTWVSDQWNELHNSPVVDVRFVDHSHVVNYIAKYISREILADRDAYALFGATGSRRYAFSQPAPPKLSKRRVQVIMRMASDPHAMRDILYTLDREFAELPRAPVVISSGEGHIILTLSTATPSHHPPPNPKPSHRLTTPGYYNESIAFDLSTLADMLGICYAEVDADTGPKSTLWWLSVDARSGEGSPRRPALPGLHHRLGHSCRNGR